MPSRLPDRGFGGKQLPPRCRRLNARLRSKRCRTLSRNFKSEGRERVLYYLVRGDGVRHRHESTARLEPEILQYRRTRAHAIEAGLDPLLLPFGFHEDDCEVAVRASDNFADAACAVVSVIACASIACAFLSPSIRKSPGVSVLMTVMSLPSRGSAFLRAAFAARRALRRLHGRQRLCLGESDMRRQHDPGTVVANEHGGMSPVAIAVAIGNKTGKLTHADLTQLAQVDDFDAYLIVPSRLIDDAIEENAHARVSDFAERHALTPISHAGRPSADASEPLRQTRSRKQLKRARAM